MKVFFTSIKKDLFVISVVFIVIGYYLITNGAASVDFVLSLLAYGLMISGTLGVIRYLLIKNNERSKRNDFVIGLIYIVLGIVLFFIKEKLRSFALIAFALAIIISGIMKIQDGIDSKRMGVHNFGIYITLMIICLAIGALIIVNPFKEETLYLVTGFGLIFSGVIDIISNIYLSILTVRYEKRLQKGIDVNKEEDAKENIPEAKFTRIDVDQKEEPLQ